MSALFSVWHPSRLRMASVWHLSRQWWGYWALAKTAIPAQIVRVGVVMLRSVKDYEDEGKLTTAERALIAAVRAGQKCKLSDTRPVTATNANTIRADLLAVLITGGKDGDDMHPVGVTLVGGYITGTLTLTHRRAVGETGLFNCHFDSAPEMRGATFTVLGLDGSRLPALNAQGINVAQDLFLRGAKVTGTTKLMGAKIGGQLDCDRAELSVPKGDALNAQGIEVAESLFLRGAKVTGGVALNGAKIGGQLDFEGAELTVPTGHALNAQGINVAQDLFLSGAKVTGTTRLISAKIGGQLNCQGATFDGKGGNALDLQRAEVGAALVWLRVTMTTGRVSLAAATVGDLWDDVTSWPKAHDPSLPSPQPQLYLDGFTYTRLIATTTRAKDRLPWLAAGSYWQSEFSPQPYTQLAKVLREMGHDREARVVLIERERRLAVQLEGEMRDELTTARNGEGGDVGRAWIRLRGTQGWHWATGRIAGYGYAPHYALQWAFWAVLVGMMVYFIGYRSGAMVPNSAIILTSTDWAAAYSTDPLRPAWYWAGETAQHFETFYALPYALDVFLPVVDLGQHSAWTQSTATWVGWFLRLFTWAMQGAGYLITGLGLAAITGWIQKDRG